MVEITWEQKLEALRAIADTSLRMRSPGNWYVSALGRDVEEANGRMLAGRYGKGKTPEEAILDDWKQIALSGATIVLNAGKRVRWNGFMWEDAR